MMLSKNYICCFGCNTISFEALYDFDEKQNMVPKFDPAKKLLLHVLKSNASLESCLRKLYLSNVPTLLFVLKSISCCF